MAEWSQAGQDLQLHVLCNVSGGLAFGSARMRLAIFKQHMRHELEALGWVNHGIHKARPALDRSKTLTHFCSKNPMVDQIQDYGLTSDFS